MSFGNNDESIFDIPALSGSGDFLLLVVPCERITFGEKVNAVAGRFIQELPGHNSSKTTEIFTHVSTKSLQILKSALTIYTRINTYIYRCIKVTEGWVSQPAVADYPKLLTGYKGVSSNRNPNSNYKTTKHE